MRKWARGALLAAAFIPAIFPLALILKYGVDFPFWDEWDSDIAGMYIKAHQHQLTFGDLVKQHNEHRILIPRLAYLALNSITHWNVIVELLFEWLMVCATSLGVLWLCAYTLSPGRRVTGRVIFLWFVCNLLIFSPAAWENWLWGIGVENVMPMLLITAMLVVLCTTWRTWLKVGVGMALAAAAEYASGNGMLAWPLGLAVLVWPPTRNNLYERRWALLAWVMLWFLLTASYFVHYARPDHGGMHPYPTSVWQVLGYIPVFAGLPFANSGSYSPFVTSVVLGLLMLIMAFAAAAYGAYQGLKQKEHELGRRMIIWLAVAGFAVMSGLLAALGRAGLGIDQPLVCPRYVSYSGYLPVALVMLVPILVEHIRSREAANRLSPAMRFCLDQLPALLVALLILFQLMTYPQSVNACKFTQIARREGKAALLLIPALPDNPKIAALVFPDIDPTRRQAVILNDMGYIRPRLVQSNNVSTFEESDPKRIGAVLGKMEQVGRASPDEAYATGWAIFTDDETAAHAVFLTYDDQERHPTIFAMADMGGRRDDIVKERGDDGYELCGWAARFNVKRVPSDLHLTTISAWAFNIDTGRAVRLQGSVQVNP